MTQTKIDPELLISLIENRPVIWDKTLENYKNKNLRSAAWREICILLKEDFEGMEEKERQKYAKEVVKKWNQIRDSWARSLNANKKTKKSGSASENVKKYCYHNQLLFLKKYIEPAETYDSANITEKNQNNAVIEDGELENSTNRNEQIEHERSVVNENPRQEHPTSVAKRFKKNYAPRQKFNVIEQKFMSFLDYQMKTQNSSQNEDRNLHFFKSILPTVALLNDDQTLQFQAGVISLLQNIRSHNGNQCPNQQPSTSKYSYQSQHGNFTPHYVASSPSASTRSSSQIDQFQPSPAESTRSDLSDFTLM